MQPYLMRKALHVYDYDKKEWKIIKRGLDIKDYRSSEELAGKVIKGEDFTNGCFIDADLGNTTFIDCDFTFANFYCANVLGLRFERCRFWLANFSRDDGMFVSMGLKDIEFVGCDMRGMELSAYDERCFSHLFDGFDNNSPKNPLVILRRDMSKKWSPQLAKNLFGSEVIPYFIVDDIEELRKLEASEAFDQALPDADRQIKILLSNKEKSLKLLNKALEVEVNVDNGLPDDFKNEYEITSRHITTFEFLDRPKDGFAYKRQIGNKDYQRMLYVIQVAHLIKQGIVTKTFLLEDALEWSIVEDDNKDIAAYDYIYTIGYEENNFLESCDMADDLEDLMDDNSSLDFAIKEMLEKIRQKIIHFYDDRVALIESYS